MNKPYLNISPRIDLSESIDVKAGMLYGVREVRRTILNYKKEIDFDKINFSSFIFGYVLIPENYIKRLSDYQKRIRKREISREDVKKGIKNQDIISILYAGFKGDSDLYSLINPEIQKEVEKHESDLNRNKTNCHLDSILEKISLWDGQNRDIEKFLLFYLGEKN
ncbi:MAG: hypothetical protein ACOC3Z_03220 [Nanoarchaeota archaeon]